MSHPRKADTSRGFNPAFTPQPQFLSPARQALRLDGALGESILSPAIHRFLLDWARLRNVYSSTKMEGSQINLDEARRVLQENQADRPQEIEVLRLSKAYERIHTARTLPRLTVDEIVALHGELFDGILSPEKHPGRLKPEQNYIESNVEGTIFEPTPPERTAQELQALLDWYYSPEIQLMEPAVAAGIFFVEFQAIHPFIDGNGRMGRLLNQRLLRAGGYRNVTLTALDGVIFRRGEAYYDALRATNAGGNLHVWLRFYCEALEAAYKEAMRRGDLRSILDEVGTGCDRDILEWALKGEVGWFQRGDFPNRQDYALVTISQSLASLTARGILQRTGERRAAKYRLNETFLRNLFAGKLQKSE